MHILEESLTFDDVLLVPSYSEVLPRQVSLETRLSRDIRLNIPLISAAMDTVTEAELAIAIAQAGGIGIIHKNMSPAHQARNVRMVKKYESGVIKEPHTISSSASIHELIKLTRAKHISGVPVVDSRRLVGIVTRRDFRFATHTEAPVSTIMTPREQLITVRENATKKEIRNLLHTHRIEKLLVVDEEGEGCTLLGLITVKDMQKAKEFPNACLDSAARLRVGAAIGVGSDAITRAEQLIDAGVDTLVIDTAHGDSKGVLDMIKRVKTAHQSLQVIGGNIATAEAALRLAKAGVDAVKVGIGPGSTCTTRVISGVGIPQISAICNVAHALLDSDIPIIADGGIRNSGDIAKALAAGAHSVMLGGIFAGTDETPGEVELYQGRAYKAYRGMGSMGAMTEQYGSSDRYFQESEEQDKLVPEGIEGRVPYKGPLSGIITQLLGGLRAAMGYTGTRNLETLHKQARFVRLTHAGHRESHAHDVNITKEPPNYRA